MLAAQYRARLTPGADNRELLAVVLAKLFAAFPASAAEPQVSTKLRMEAYFEALATIPAWAVAQGRDAILRGETAFDGRFAPTPPQLARAARDAMRQTVDDCQSLARLEHAAVRHEPSPEQRVRVAAGFAELRRELGGKGPGDAAASAQARFAEMCAEAGVDPESIKDAPDRGTFRRMG